MMPIPKEIMDLPEKERNKFFAKLKKIKKKRKLELDDASEAEKMTCR